MNPRRRGLTLIEMLVVMVILAILAASVGVVLVPMAGRGRVEKARSQIRLLEDALSGYRAAFGSYPPDTGYGLDMESSPGTYDAGSLWRYLLLRVKDPATGEFRGPFLAEWPSEDKTEYADAHAGKSFFLTDPWGRPYAFVGERKRVVHNPGSFDLFSCGPNGETASDEAQAEPNLAYDGADNDGDGVVDDSGELGAAAANGTDEDDISNWSSR